MASAAGLPHRPGCGVPVSIADLLGAAGAILSFALWLPQASTSWRQRRDPVALAGLSIGMLALLLVNALCWLGYALVTKAYWAGVTSLGTIPMSIFLLWLVLRSRSLVSPGADGDVISGDVLGCTCGWLDASVPHAYFVTAPPGYGTIFDPCPGGELAQGHPIISNRSSRQMAGRLDSQRG